MYQFSDAADQALWEELVASDDHLFQFRLRIYNGTTGDADYVYYYDSSIIEMTTSLRAFSGEQPGVGGCLAGELTVRMLKPAQEIPRMAMLFPYVRVTDGTRTSAWMPQGWFWIDTRETTNNDDGLEILSLHAYDAMLKTEADYPSTSHAWPYSDINVVREIAVAIGRQTSLSSNAGIDERTVALMTKNYQIGLPAGYSMREVLGNIAAMYGGNWIFNYTGQLQLVVLGGIPAATNYLVTENGSPITFGGVRILV